jgi:ribonuclease HI
MYAALAAIRSVSSETQLTIVSTQDFVDEAMNKKLPLWEHEGWAGVQHREVLQCLAAELKARRAPTVFKVIRADSPQRAQCRQAAVLAKRAARAATGETWDLSLPYGTALPGLSLKGNRQRIFYRSIREEKVKALPPRPSTVKMLDLVRSVALNTFDKYVSDADIWKSTDSKDFLPRVTQFLWRGIHNSHRVGKYWTHIPECDDRAICKDCGELEDLDHILTRCTSPGQELVWRAAETLWRERETEWPSVSLGTILGCGLAEFSDDKGRTKYGTERLYRILMSESAYLIWTLRNNRVISRDGEPASEGEILNKWKFAINQRLQTDITLANRPLCGKRPALAKPLVLGTWSGTLDNERSLPANWLWEPRVLVGSRAFTHAQPRQNISRGVG